MKLGLLATALILAASSAVSQHAHQSGSPTQTGQSQFAAIAEIVTLLRDNQDTDWAQVNILALRNHLVDMDNVTTRASVTRSVDDMRITFSVMGDAVTAASIQRMVLAHSPMLQQVTDWTVVATKLPNGAKMVVDVVTNADLQQIAGLGFFGLMTIGAHHQQHHLTIATGGSPH